MSCPPTADLTDLPPYLRSLDFIFLFLINSFPLVRPDLQSREEEIHPFNQHFVLLQHILHPHSQHRVIHSALSIVHTQFTPDQVVLLLSPHFLDLRIHLLVLIILDFHSHLFRLHPYYLLPLTSEHSRYYFIRGVHYRKCKGIELSRLRYILIAFFTVVLCGPIHYLFLASWTRNIAHVLKISQDTSHHPVKSHHEPFILPLQYIFLQSNNRAESRQRCFRESSSFSFGHFYTFFFLLSYPIM